MWSCCGSRDPKNNKYLVANANGQWETAHKDVSTPGDSEFEVEVAYVALNSHDKAAIVSKKGVGHSFSGTVKAVGKTLESNAIKKGDKVYGFYRGDTGALSDFVLVSADSIKKVPAGVDLKTAAALPHIAHVANQLNSSIAKDKNVHFSGPKGGYYESVFNGLVKKNKAVAKPNADTLVDFILHSEGAAKWEFKPENYVQAWSFDSSDNVHQDKRYKSVDYTGGDLAAADTFAQSADNADILKNIHWSKDELVSNKDSFTNALKKLSESGRGPIVVDVDVLKSLPKKEEPKVEKKDEKKEGTTGK